MENYCRKYNFLEFDERVLYNYGIQLVKTRFAPIHFEKWNLKLGQPSSLNVKERCYNMWHKLIIPQKAYFFIISDDDNYHYLIDNYFGFDEIVYVFDQMHNLIEYIEYRIEN